MPKSQSSDRKSLDGGAEGTPNIDHAELEDMAACGCTVAEAAAWYGCKTSVMRARLKDPVLKEIWERGRGRGRVKLRQAQFKLAEKNISMAMLLGRQLLGQTETDHDRAPTLRLIVDTGIRRDEGSKD